ncbi:MAG: twin-arginine translocase subunit TatC [Chloroflexota bacterium]|nr:twin-arginine translocase subunit TatC [Chloroflexota bacterium]
MNEPKFTILEHLRELRTRVFWAVLSLMVTTGISFFFAFDILAFLKRPAVGVSFIYTEMTEMFGTYMKVSLLSGVVLAIPFISYQLLMFILPALSTKEKKWVVGLMLGATLSFLAGAAFAYFVAIPPAVQFLTTWGSDIAAPQIRIGNYISLVTGLIFWIGVAFETPLVIFILASMGVVTPRMLIMWWKYAIVLAFIIGGFVTPTPDPVNQTLVAGPIVVLYGLSIGLAWLAWRGRRSRAASKSN